MNDCTIDFRYLKNEFEARTQRIHENFRLNLGAVAAMNSERATIASNAGIHGEWRHTNAVDLQNYLESLGRINYEICQHDWPDNIGHPKVIIGKCQKLIIEGSFNYTNNHPLPKVDFRFCDFCGDVEFSGIEFQSSANFSHVIFRNDVGFGGAKFRDEANFASIFAHRPISFSGVTFSSKSRTIFKEATFLDIHDSTERYLQKKQILVTQNFYITPNLLELNLMSEQHFPLQNLMAH